MEIIFSSGVPYNNYFTASDCEPQINEDGTLTVFRGRGKRGSWGSAQVTATVVVNNEHITALHVGFSHKYRGGQFWRYYVANPLDDGGVHVARLKWAQLPDYVRSMVLEAATGTAPAWAKSPGKLRGQ